MAFALASSHASAQNGNPRSVAPQLPTGINGLNGTSIPGFIPGGGFVPGFGFGNGFGGGFYYGVYGPVQTGPSIGDVSIDRLNRLNQPVFPGIMSRVPVLGIDTPPSRASATGRTTIPIIDGTRPRTVARPDVDAGEAGLMRQMERQMERWPFVAGTVVAVGQKAVRIRYSAGPATRTGSFGKDSVYFQTDRGRLATAATHPSLVSNGVSVLVPQIVPRKIKQAVGGRRQETRGTSARKRTTWRRNRR
jgi:hypothetical protein